MDVWEQPEETSAEEAPGRGGLHPVNVGHLVMGIALTGLTLVWMAVSTDVVQLEDARWLLPAPWIAAGVAGLVATALRRPRADDTP